VLDDGRLEIVDPTFEDVPLLKEVDPDFRIESAPLWNFTAPRFLRSRLIGCGLTRMELDGKGNDVLWELHDRPRLRGDIGTRSPGEASLLDLKIELARRELSNCSLCAHHCGVNRLDGEAGHCGLGPEALVGEYFPHIAEEPSINPSFLIGLLGCGLRCRHCQQSHLLDVPTAENELLSPGLWKEVLAWPVRSLSFAGGNPDESLYGILKFLNSAPETFLLPVVWNCHGYSSPFTIKLLDGVVDAYLPDFKYWNDECAYHLSAAPDYGPIALEAIKQMLSQQAAVIVRILVLPGHLDCCHLPALDALGQLNAENLFISIRDQYSLAFLVSPKDGPLAGKLKNKKEVQAVREHAFRLKIKFVL
jgi:putative pyruvate formate lyase activating enzyme